MDQSRARTETQIGPKKSLHGVKARSLICARGIHGDGLPLRPFSHSEDRTNGVRRLVHQFRPLS